MQKETREKVALLTREIFRSPNMFLYILPNWALTFAFSVRIHLSSFGRYLARSALAASVGRVEASTAQQGWKGMKRVQCHDGIAAHAFRDERFPCIRESRGRLPAGVSAKFPKTHPLMLSEERDAWAPKRRRTLSGCVCVCARADTYFFLIFFHPPRVSEPAGASACRWTESGIWATPNRCGRSMEIKHQWVRDESWYRARCFRFISNNNNKRSHVQLNRNVFHSAIFLCVS